MKQSAIFYAQSGGATSVINATAASVILTAREYGYSVYVGRNGICGALAEELYDASIESPEELQALARMPGCAFGSCRLKLPNYEDNQEVYRRIFAVFAAHGIGVCLYNGGNDSQDTLLKLAHASKCLGYPLQVIGIPKTIDNDLYGTHSSPGYGSAAKYIATATREIYCDLAGMAPTSTKLFLLEVMGRDTGWLALAGGLAHDNKCGDECGGTQKLPIMLLLPEQAWSWEACAARAERLVAEQGCAVLVVAEGVSEWLAESNGASDKHALGAHNRLVDAFGHQQLSGAAPALANMFRDRLGYKTQWAVAGYLQRAAAHTASAADFASATAVGRWSIAAVANGQNEIMMAIKCDPNLPHQLACSSVPLAEVANRVVKVPQEFWDAQTYDITECGAEYLRPLVAGSAVSSDDALGLPRLARLKKRLTAKRLPEIDWRDLFKG